MSIYFFPGYVYGRGVYFARDASYAASYARPSGVNYFHWALLGQYYACISAMIVPPPEINIGAIYVSFQIKKTSFITAQNLIVLFIYFCLGGFGGGARCMYLARVLVGKYCRGNFTMVVPPPKNPYRNEEILYESVVDNLRHPSKFVVFYDNQCYPEYVITFFSQ